MLRHKSISLKNTLILITFILSLSLLNFAQEAKENRSGSADKSLQSVARVNPSTFAMEFSLPLADYPGRAETLFPLQSIIRPRYGN